MNYHKQAIDIIEYNKGLRDKLIVQIAKDNPAALVNAFNSIGSEPWVVKVAPLLEIGQRIPAIKLCRELTGMGLIEAKAAVESLNIEPKS